MTKAAISYLRASDSEINQPNSLAVQRSIVESFADKNCYDIQREFFEYGSGTDNERQQWKDALAYAELHDCYVLCYRVDRFTRSLASFDKTSGMLGRLRFAELGDVVPSPIILSVLVAVAQNEAENARIRIKTTMQMLKERDGRVFGNPRIKETAVPASLKVRQANASQFNNKIQQLVSDFKSAGYSLSDCVDRLNNIGIMTRRNKPWTYHLLYRVVNYNKGQDNGKISI